MSAKEKLREADGDGGRPRRWKIEEIVGIGEESRKMTCVWWSWWMVGSTTALTKVNQICEKGKER
jgi:hypothetical protein